MSETYDDAGWIPCVINRLLIMDLHGYRVSLGFFLRSINDTIPQSLPRQLPSPKGALEAFTFKLHSINILF